MYLEALVGDVQYKYNSHVFSSQNNSIDIYPAVISEYFIIIDIFLLLHWVMCKNVWAFQTNKSSIVSSHLSGLADHTNKITVTG